MPRVTSAVPRKKRHKKILKQARGYFGASSRQYKSAKDAVEKAMLYNYRDRRQRRRNFRRLWITRINAATRTHDMSYSEFMGKIKSKKINLNRKVLADLAVNNAETFKAIINRLK